MKNSFPPQATEHQRSFGQRHRYKGNEVLPNGYPRSFNSPAGGNSPRYDKRRGLKHGQNWRRHFWERDGKNDSPPASWVRGWQ